MRKYEGNDNYGQPKTKYVEDISTMEYKELIRETKDKIWLSAYANNNPRSDYHWHVDVCYDELLKRDGNDSGYVRAYESVSRSI
ncbi:hypothetical protein NV379_02420 [Paenibacillus sp. N1-5-1-14]|uniref:hypothetical protein n=1 Tax=Paenibacillus radicibacter TaxID=2972488 RepID=UPI002159A755|nr:hypothetical protein [Paenibacillus radicibacter]MCR8641502.1 hypothetical protein [Paenibacillus radicibacter]